MSSSFGGTVKLQGENEYRKALKEIQSSLRLVSSEMKLTNTAFQNGDKSLKNTRTSYSNMNKAIQEQKNKIANLKNVIVEMTKKYGENSDKVKKFKTQLNVAENQLLKMENATKKGNKELKKMKNGFDEAGKGGLEFSDILKAELLSAAIIAGVKALGKAIKEVGKAVLDIGKQSLQSYADYEQLVGGVETLFKDSAGTVEKYANNAYKTAGLSANEYMETVTSFSASLLQSLGQDTDKASKYADQAIIDMADNANKMGTDMSSIQNAYQGFAKQNYTMLDNLKLGYGGTKTEMERLIADANKVKQANGEMANLSIDSFADVTEAIHIIQTEMGITGTTAKEASTTIQGSIGSMKSAWTNLLTGLANGNADLENLIGNLVDSVITAADNIIPVVERIVNSIIQALPDILNKINEHLPEFLIKGTEILHSMMTGIQNNLPMIMTTIMQVINTLIKSATDMLPEILRMGISILVELVQGIAQALPEIIPTMIDAVLLMVDTLIDNIDLVVEAGIELIIGLAGGLIEALPKLIEKIPIIIEKLINAIVNNLPKIIETGIRLVVKLAEGLIRAIPQLIRAIPQIINSIVSGFERYKSNMSNIGLNLVKGIWNGISNATQWILNKIKGFGNSVLNGLKSFFGIHSPSTLFKEQIGKNLALGVGEGFEDTMSKVSDEMQNSIPTEFNTAVNVNRGYGEKLNSLSSSFNYNDLVSTFVSALKIVKIELDDEQIGRFVVNTVTKEVYA